MPKGKIRELFTDRFRHNSPETMGAFVEQSRHGSVEMNGVSASTTDCRRALSDWNSKFHELDRHVEQGSATATALASARTILGDITFPTILDKIPAGSPVERDLFGKIVTTRREFDEKYEELESTGNGNSGVRGERLGATDKKVIIDVKDIVNVILDLARHVQPYRYLCLEQGKVKDLAEKAQKLEEAIRESCTAGHVYYMNNSGSGHQFIHYGSGPQNSSLGSGAIFSGEQSRGTYHFEQFSGTCHFGHPGSNGANRRTYGLHGGFRW